MICHIRQFVPFLPNHEWKRPVKLPLCCTVTIEAAEIRVTFVSAQQASVERRSASQAVLIFLPHHQLRAVFVDKFGKLVTYSSPSHCLVDDVESSAQPDEGEGGPTKPLLKRSSWKEPAYYGHEDSLPRGRSTLGALRASAS